MARVPKITPRQVANARRQASRATARRIESNVGPVQKAGRAVDSGVKTVADNYRAVGKDIASGAQAVKAGYNAASKKVGKVATRYGQGDFRPESKAIKSGAKALGKAESTGMQKVGKYLSDGFTNSKPTQRTIGRAATYGSAALMGGAYAAGRYGSSWTQHKKEQTEGPSKSTPYGL